MRLSKSALVFVGLGSLPLLSTAEVPQSIKGSMKRADAVIAKIVAIPDSKRTFANTLGALDDLSGWLDDEVSLPIFMQNVSNDPKERDNAREAEEEVGNWQIALGKREDLYRAVKAYANKHPKLHGEQKRFLEFTLRDYRRSGMDLTKADRAKLQSIEMELNKLGIQFSQNIADDSTHIAVKADALTGVPEAALKRLKLDGDTYQVGMDTPTLEAILAYCTNESTRKDVWFAYKRRGGQKNVDVLEKMLRLRYQQAHLLGYKSAADFETEVRMAHNAATVAKFYRELQPIVRKKALVDFSEYTAAKRTYTKDPKATLNPWDNGFYKNLLRKTRYAVDTSKISEYFPMEKVVDGLFTVTQTLYGLKYKDVTADIEKLGLPRWDKDIKLFEVDDKASGKMLGRFYVDLFPRAGKYSHAACFGLKPHMTFSSGLEQPGLVALVCNFTKPSADQPSLLPHDEVETFFHEFGHCLHNLMSEAHMERFAGTGVARDFVEAPSQMIENWVWNSTVLKTFARHYKTGQPLPEKLLQGMLNARYLGSGMEAEHQFYFGIFDQKFHTAPNGICDTSKVAVDTLGQVELFKGVPGTMVQASFTHLVGYQAAYYGYMWSLVYAQDMFQRFEQLGLLSPKAGMYYRKHILSKGGTQDEMEMLHEYLGRKPNMAAFLRHLGLDPKQTKK